MATQQAPRDSATKGALTPQLTPEEEQEKLMEEAKNVVNTQAFYMKRCLVCGDAVDMTQSSYANPLMLGYSKINGRLETRIKYD
jgi:hypothetical protein